MAFTSTTLNPGSGGDTLATQTSGGNKYQAVVPVWGPDSGAFNVTGIGLGIPVQIVAGTKATYRAAITALVPAASATDVFTITGSATKIVKIDNISVSGTAGTAIVADVQLSKRSTADTGGASTAPTVVAVDATDAAGTAVVAAYTANPTTGSLIGIVGSKKLALIATATPVSAVDRIEWNFNGRGGKGLYLNAAAQQLCVNLNAQSITSGTLDIEVTWSEE